MLISRFFRYDAFYFFSCHTLPCRAAMLLDAVFDADVFISPFAISFRLGVRHMPPRHVKIVADALMKIAATLMPSILPA